MFSWLFSRTETHPWLSRNVVIRGRRDRLLRSNDSNALLRCLYGCYISVLSRTRRRRRPRAGNCCPHRSTDRRRRCGRLVPADRGHRDDLRVAMPPSGTRTPRFRRRRRAVAFRRWPVERRSRFGSRQQRRSRSHLMPAWPRVNDWHAARPSTPT